jgi:N-acetylmuramoyl-L-alanine amidase
MTGAARIPRPARAIAIEWRARRIEDPLRRLRYLRGMGEDGGQRRWGPSLRAASALALLLVPIASGPQAALRHSPAVTPSALRQIEGEPPAPVWLVETAEDHETYSNGLRVENRFVIRGRPRRYAVFERNQPDLDAIDWRSEPAGIVYHATESHLAPFEPEDNALLQQIGEALLDYVRRRQAYHFVIDRFGRVYRVVAESDAANHAGHSIWADRRWLYLNLNAAFLGVAFEGDNQAALAPAQVRAGRALTEMLRSRYGIAADNCITHAQVSINPRNTEIGWHTDGVARFPFEAMGLSDNYRLPVPAVALFGFTYERAMFEPSGGRVWTGLDAAMQAVRQEAADLGMPTARYARLLRKRYQGKIAALRSAGALEETNDEKQ